MGHRSQEEWAKPLNQHRSLSLFDIGHNKKRVHFQKSRIPILAQTHQRARQSDTMNGTSVRGKLDREGSKIPVYKIVESSRKVTFEDEAMPFSRVKNSDGRKTLKLRGLELSSLPSFVFQQTNVESLILSPERESCLDVRLIISTISSTCSWTVNL